MPVSFGNPGLLLGAFAAALPVIIHFLSRRRVRRLAFSDLRFLDEVQARQARSLGVRRWLLLLLRVLAILLVALAAAAPRWGGLAATGTRSVLLVVDTSASMGTQTPGRHPPGRRRGRLPRACWRPCPQGAAVQLISAGAATEAMFAEWLPVGAGVDRGLGALAVSDGGLDLPAVLRLAARQTARAPGAAVDVVLVGDLQALPADPDLAEAAAVLGRGRTRAVDPAPGGGARDPGRRAGGGTAGPRGAGRRDGDGGRPGAAGPRRPGLHPRTGRAARGRSRRRRPGRHGAGGALPPGGAGGGPARGQGAQGERRLPCRRRAALRAGGAGDHPRAAGPRRRPQRRRRRGPRRLAGAGRGPGPGGRRLPLPRHAPCRPTN